MPESVRPVAKCVYLCDDLIADPATGKVTLVNLLDTVRVPPTGAFPYCLEKLCVFVWWRDGLGKVRSHVEIVRATTNELVRRTKDCMIDFDRRTASVFARYKLENCVFPAPGYYFVEVYCEGEFVDDQIIRVVSEGGDRNGS